MKETAPPAIIGSKNFIRSGLERLQAQRNTERLETPSDELKLEYCEGLPGEKVEEALKARYSKLGINRQFHGALINGFNILYGTREPIQSPGEASYVSPAASLIALALYEFNEEEESDIVSDIKTGYPPRLPIIHRYKRRVETAAEQYAINPIFEDFALPDHNSRRVFTIANKYARPFLETCYVLSQLEHEIPHAVATGLDYFTSGLKSQMELYSIALLQTMDILGVLNDERYKSLTLSLRDVVMETISTYKVLQNTYAYTVIDRAGFWIDGELKQKRRGRGISQNAGTVVDTTSEAAGNTTIRLPSLDGWNAGVRKIKALEQKIHTSTPLSIIKGQTISEAIRSQGNSSKKRLLRTVRQKIAEVAVARTLLAKIKRETYESYTHLFAKELRYLGGRGEYDERIFAQIMQCLAEGVKDNESLTMKTRGWLARYAQPTQGNENRTYPIDYPKLAHHPLYQWIFTLQDPEARKNLGAALANQPEEFTALHRLMTTAFIHETLFAEEESFVFIPTYMYSDEAKFEAQCFFVNVCAFFEQATPTQEQVVREVAFEVREKTVDLTTQARLNVQRGVVQKWLTHPFILGSRIHHNIGLTERPFVTATKLAVALGISIGGTLGAIELVSRLTGVEGIVSLFQHAGDQRSLYGRNLTPDSISRDALQNTEPRFYGTVLHIPSSERIIKSVPQFFIPLEIENSNMIASIGGRFENLTIGRLPGAFESNPNQLVYKPDFVPRFLSPPLGYRFVRVFQEVGDRPWILGSGELLWGDEKKVPSTIVLVAEPLETETNPFGTGMYEGVVMYKGLRNEPYDLSSYSYEAAVTINSELAGDPQLQALHRQMVEELQGMMTNGKNDPNSLSEFIVRYSSQYYQYVQNNRFYSLDLNVETSYDRESSFRYLETIADFPNSGYYCGYAAKSFQDFWASVGVQASYQSGLPTAVYGDELWNYLGHANNRIFLPNGMIAFIDTTPPVKEGKTPTEDLLALTWKDPNDRRIRPDFWQELARVSVTYGIPVIGGTTLGLGLFDPLELRMMGAVTTYIGLLNYEEPDVFADNAAYVFELLGEVDRDEYGGLIRWIAEEFIPPGKPQSTAEGLRQSIEVSTKEVYNAIRDGWHSNQHGLRGLLPNAVNQEIEAQLRLNGDLQGISKGLTTAIELGLLMSGMEVLDLIARVKRNIATQSVRLAQDTKDQLLQQEKVRLAKQLTLVSARDIDMRSRNATYLAYLYQVFSYP